SLDFHLFLDSTNAEGEIDSHGRSHRDIDSGSNIGLEAAERCGHFVLPGGNTKDLVGTGPACARGSNGTRFHALGGDLYIHHDCATGIAHTAENSAGNCLRCYPRRNWE